MYNTGVAFPVCLITNHQNLAEMYLVEVVSIKHNHHVVYSCSVALHLQTIFEKHGLEPKKGLRPDFQRQQGYYASK